jgi:vacuolar-type H+-ATPase subunit I/STV1
LNATVPVAVRSRVGVFIPRVIITMSLPWIRNTLCGKDAPYRIRRLKVSIPMTGSCDEHDGVIIIYNGTFCPFCEEDPSKKDEKIEKLTDEVGDLENERDDALNELDSMETERDEAVREKEEFERELDEEKGEVEDLKDEIKKLVQEVKDLRDEIQDLNNKGV